MAIKFLSKSRVSCGVAGALKYLSHSSEQSLKLCYELWSQEQPFCCGAYLGTAHGLMLLLQSVSRTETTASDFQFAL